MNLISLDLEMNQPSNTIIQVGVVVGNISNGVVYEKHCFYTDTKEQISQYITTLTKVTNDDLKTHGQSLTSIYSEIKRLHEYYLCFRNPLTWGGGDSILLRKQLNETGEHIDWTLGDRWIDAKTVYQSYCFANDMKPQSGLAKSMTKLGLKFQGAKHNAMDDAYNTFSIYYTLLKRMERK
ncbi:hypothetical protein EBZ38_07625 [bacterium]|nr:hypothetical protein [bacterium]